MLRRISLFLLLLFSISHATFLDFDLLRTVLLPGVALVAVTILAIVWMLSDALNMPHLKAWVRMEIREIFAAVVLVVVVYAILFSSDNLGILFGEDLSGNHGIKDVAVQKVEDQIATLEVSYQDLIYATHYLGVSTATGYSFSVSYWYLSGGYFSSPYGGLKTVQLALSRGGQGLFTAMSIYMGILTFLKFFTSKAVAALIPVALSLRFLPFTRKAANSLIAVLLGVIVFFPFAVLLTDWVNNQVSMDAPSLDSSKFDWVTASPIMDFVGWICGEDNFIIKNTFTMTEIGWVLLICPPFLAGFMACAEAIVNGIYPAVIFFYQWIALGVFLVPLTIQEAVLLADEDYLEDMNEETFDFLEAVNDYVVLAIVDCLLIVVITYGGIKAIASALGEEQYLIALQRLV